MNGADHFRKTDSRYVLGADSQRVLQVIVGAGEQGMLAADARAALPDVGTRAVYSKLLYLAEAGYLYAEDEARGARSRQRYTSTGKHELQAQIKQSRAALPLPPEQGVIVGQREFDEPQRWDGPYLRPLPGRADAHAFRACPSRRGDRLVHCYAQR